MSSRFSDPLFWWLFWFFVVLILADLPRVEAAENDRYAYSGTWVDVGLPSDGPMSVGITELAGGKYNARFTGIWQGAKFDHVIEFAGPLDSLQGDARINAAKYTWSGKLTNDTFTGSYRSNRGNDGTWTMKRVK